MIKLTPNFSLEELTFSETAVRLGIDNTPHEGLLDNICVLANGMQDVRDLLGKPMLVSSGYRCLKLNRLLKSKDTSAHVQGLACDFTSPSFGTPNDIVSAVIRSNIDFHQIILEFDRWVHLAFVEDGGTPKKEALIIDKKGARFYEH